MNSFDPCLSEEVGVEVIDRELSVEEVALMDRVEVVEPLPLDVTFEEETKGGESPGTEAAIRYRRVSGRYRSCPRYWELILRVDFDGYRPMRRVSGDFYRHTGSTVSYFGSFIVHRPMIRVTQNVVILEGVAKTTWATNFNKLRVTIPRHNIFQPPATAQALWMNSQNRRGASYSCLWESAYFRTVDLEQDFEKGVSMFTSYNTGSLPSGGPARVLTVARAYAEAGLEMRDTGGRNEVPVVAGSTWSNAELHDAMERHFSRWRDQPQWKVWLLHANRHEFGSGLLGIMFDQEGRQRQGCATFYTGIGGSRPEDLRVQLYTNVHELGHCFNLFHSFHKKYMDPPLPNRLLALSWMNYPWRYPDGGAAGFWSKFPFLFDNLEVIHLRHGFRNNVVMGGNPFGKGAAVHAPEEFDDPIVDASGLVLELSGQKLQPLGAPVRVGIRLALRNGYERRVTQYLNPNFGFVQLAIAKPDGEMFVFEPLFDYCIRDEGVLLTPDKPETIPVSAYVGYDRHAGLVFNQPGVYKLRASYSGFDESVILSNVLEIHVLSPKNEDDEKVAELLLNDDMGLLFTLEGSDSPSLATANSALDEILEEHRDHPVALHASLVKARNAKRDFKTITEDNQVEVRSADLSQAESMLSNVIEASKGEEGVDDITLMTAMRELFQVLRKAGNEQGAAATKRDMLSIAQQKNMPESLIQALQTEEE